MKPTTNEKIIYQLVESGELEIDNQGRIWRVKKKTGKKTGGTLLRPCKRVRAERPWGEYLQVRAMLNWKRYHTQAHRLVYHHFKGPIPKGLTINHENGKKHENWPDNLELATYSENTNHAIHILKRHRVLKQYGEDNSMVKLTDKQVEEIRTLYAKGDLNQMELAIKYGVCFQTISRTVRGEIKTKQNGPIADYTHRRMNCKVGRNAQGQFCSVL